MTAVTGVVPEVGEADFDRAVREAGDPVLVEFFAAGLADRTGLPADPMSWVPGDACTLPSADRPLRLAQFDDLFAAALQSVDRIDATRLRLNLHPRPEVAARVADLAVRETGCCGFFTFALTAAEQVLRLEVSVPEAHASVLDGLAVRASAGAAA